MKLNKYYAIDECNDEDALYEKLNILKDEAKINYELNDGWAIKITDLELTLDDEKELVEFLESLDLYPTTEEYDDSDDEDDYNDSEDDFKPSKKGNRSYEDEDYGNY